MLLNVTAVNEDVIEKNQDKLASDLPKQVIHRGLKRRWSIRQSEGHYNKLVVTINCTKSCFGYVFLGYSDLVVSRA